MARPARLTRVEQQALTKERLLAAAETVFAQRGYGGASVDLIAAEAGYSKGAVYSNFPSKEAIFLELARRHLERDLLELERIVASDPTEIGEAAHFIKHDVADAEAWSQVVDEAQKRFGGVDILVNNAATYNPKPLLETTVGEMQRHFAINVVGPMLGMQAVFEPMRASGKGSIVNISSLSGIRHIPGQIAYATSKWALRGMSGCAASEYGRVGIRVNSIHPGIIDTAMIQLNSPEQNDYGQSLVPSRRRGAPSEVSEAVLFLASDAASYVNGAELFVDGGLRL